MSEEKMGLGKAEEKYLAEPRKGGIKLSANAITVLERRYLKKDAEGNVIETPGEMFWRVAQAVARAEQKPEDWQGVFYEMMANLDFLPNSPTLMNAGRELGQLSACFVLPVGDSMEEIFDAVRDTAIIHKSGGGTGFSFSRLRPRNDRVRTTAGVSSGPISFMKVFNAATEAVKQGGTRRGANMGILRVDHPDIVEFIQCKEDQKELTNFNISVALTDKFMKALYNQGFYDLINPRTGEVVRKESAPLIFKLLVDHAWKNGEPGIIFIDRMNEGVSDVSMRIESTNPCGEQPLLPYESCNLGSINLGNFVKGTDVDWDRLAAVVGLAVRFLDDVIDVNKYPLEKIREMTLKTRKIGLGVMGWADMLIKMGIPYGSDLSFNLAEQVMGFIQRCAVEKTAELASARGESVWEVELGRGRRNTTVTTIAPTGTLSIIAGCSSGIEPIFAVAYTKTVMDNDKLVEVHPAFDAWLKAGDLEMSRDEILGLIVGSASIQGCPATPETIQAIFKTAYDITPEQHIRMQAAFQKHTDNAVSKTVNFPKEATREDVEKVFLLAWDLGCKGVTVYRDGSRDNQVLTVEKKWEDPVVPADCTGKVDISRAPAMREKGVEEEAKVSAPADRPPILLGRTFKQQTGCGSIYITINNDVMGRPCELFATIGKAGGCADSQSQAIGRMVSMAWRNGISAEEVLRQLSDISCHSHHGMGPNRVQSCADAVSKAIRSYLESRKGSDSGGCGSEVWGASVVADEAQVVSQRLFNAMMKDKAEGMSARVKVNGACPECGGPVQHESGCTLCRTCGFSECG